MFCGRVDEQNQGREAGLMDSTGDGLIGVEDVRE